MILNSFLFEFENIWIYEDHKIKRNMRRGKIFSIIIEMNENKNL